jgi:hypothetical protein
MTAQNLSLITSFFDFWLVFRDRCSNSSIHIHKQQMVTGCAFIVSKRSAVAVYANETAQQLALLRNFYGQSKQILARKFSKTRSRNNCCCGKAISITHFCLCVLVWVHGR